MLGFEERGKPEYPETGWDASPSQGYPPAVCRRYPIIHLGEERQNGVKFLSKETTRRARLKPRTSRSGVGGVNHSATLASTKNFKGFSIIFPKLLDAI